MGGGVKVMGHPREGAGMNRQRFHCIFSRRLTLQIKPLCFTNQ